MDSWKLAVKRVLSNISLALLAFVSLCLVVQKPKVMKNVPDLVLFVDKFAKVVVDISIPRIDSSLRSNIRLAFKWASSRFLAAYSWRIWSALLSLIAIF